jgi:hypothetical protein
VRKRDEGVLGGCSGTDRKLPSDSFLDDEVTASSRAVRGECLGSDVDRNTGMLRYLNVLGGFLRQLVAVLNHTIYN